MSEERKYETPGERIDKLKEALKRKRSIQGIRTAVSEVLQCSPSDMQDFSMKIGNHKWRGVIYQKRNNLMGSIISFFDSKIFIVRGYPRIKYSDDSRVYLRECIAQEKIDGCYDKDTEVLTTDGWKFWDALTGNESFFSRDQEGHIVTEKADRIIKIPYHGKLLHFRMKNLDLKITPDHWNFVSLLNWKNKKASPPIRIQAKDMKGRQCHFYADGDWKGEEKETIQIGSKIFKMIDWLLFFGMWSTDGTRTNKKKGDDQGYQVTICQRKNDLLDLFEAVKKMYPQATHYFNKSNRCFVISICDRELWDYLDQFGKKDQRHIPKEIKNLCKEQLLILFRSLMRGDGSEREKYMRFWTCSSRMRDDFQELSLKVGYSASFTPIMKDSVFNGRKIKATRPTFTLNVRLKNSRPLWLPALNGKFKKRNLSEEEYEGLVYCAIVPHHALYVRRNGIPIWSGNTNLGIFMLPDGSLMGKTRLVVGWNNPAFKMKDKTWKQLFEMTSDGLIAQNITNALKENDYVFYGELYGKLNPGDFIKYSTDISFKVFDILDRKSLRFLSPEKVYEICDHYGIPRVDQTWEGMLTDKEIQRIEFELQDQLKDDGCEGYVAKTFCTDENDVYMCKLKCEKVKEECWTDAKPMIPSSVIKKSVHKVFENYPDLKTMEDLEPHVLEELREDVEDILIEQSMDRIRAQIRWELTPRDEDLLKIVIDKMKEMQTRGMDLRKKGHVLSNLSTALGSGISGGKLYSLYNQALRELT